MLNKSLVCAGLLGATLLLSGCRTSAGTGSLIGALGGAAVGRAIGHHNGNESAGTWIGAAAGALGGYVVGNEIDKDREGYRYEGDPRYEPGHAPRERVYYDDDPPVERVYVERPRERVIYRERIYVDDCGRRYYRRCW
jgi:phage tail tape-measure protein